MLPSGPIVSTSARPRPTRRQRLQKGVGVAVAIFTIAFFGFWGFANTEYGQAKLVGLLRDVIRDELGLEANITRFDVYPGFFPPSFRFVVRDVRVEHPTEGLLISAEKIAIRPSLLRLLTGKVFLRDLVVTAPVIRLVVRDGAIVNGPTLPSGSGGATRIPMGIARIDGARVHVVGDLPFTASARGIDIRAELRRERYIAYTISARGGELRHARGIERLQRFQLRGEIDVDASLRIDEALVRTSHAGLALAQVTVPFAHPERSAGRMHARVDLDALENLPHGLSLPDLAGQIEVGATLRSTTTGPAARMHVVATRPQLDEYVIGERVVLDVDVTERLATIRDGALELIRDGGVARLEGTIALEAPYRVDVNLDFQDIQFAKLMEQIDVTPDAIVWWFLSGPAELHGTLYPLLLDGPIRVDTRDFFVSQGPWHAEPRARVIGVPTGRIEGRVRIDAEALRFLNLDLRTPRSQLMCDVVIGFGQEFSVHARGDTVDLADVSPLVDMTLAGVGSVDVTAGGTYSEPTLVGTTSVRGFEFDGMRFGDVTGNMQLAEGGMAAHFPELHGTKGDSSYVVRDLYLDFSDDRFEATADVRLDRLSLDDAYHAFRLEEDDRFAPYRAFGSGDVRVRYTVGFPHDSPTGTMVADLSFAMDAANFAGFRFDDGLMRGQFRWLNYERGIDGAELDLDTFTLHKGDATIAVSGSMGLDGALRMNLAADHIALPDLEGIGDRFPELSGHTTVIGTISGTNAVPRMDLDVALSNISWTGNLIGDARAYVRLTERDDPWIQEALTWDPASPPRNEECAAGRMGFARGRWPSDPPVRTATGYVPASTREQAFVVCGSGFGDTARLDLALGWTSVFPHRGNVVFREFSLTPFAPPTMQGAEYEGRMTGTIALDAGAMMLDESAGGTVTFDRFFLRADDVSLTNEGPIMLGLDRGFVTVRRAEVSSEGTRLRFSGGGGLVRGLRLTVEGELDAASLVPLSETVGEASGRIGLRVEVRGDIDDPSFFGEARVAGVGFRSAALPVEFTNLGGRVEFSERRVRFEDFEADVGGGRMTLGGDATLSEGALESYQVDIELADVAFRPDEGIDVQLGLQARASYRRGDRIPTLRGRVEIDRLRYSRPVHLSPTIGELYRPTRTEVERYDPALDLVALDLEVIQRAPMQVRTNIADLDFMIAQDERPFRVVGTDQRPGVLGSVEIPRGTIRFRSSAFEVRRGAIEFDDASRVNPNFDVLALTEVRRNSDPNAPSWRIQLRAYGNVDGFRLDASSTPSMSQQDIMLLLVIGMTSAEAQQLSASDLGTTAIEALSALSGVEGRVSDVLGVIDDVSLTTVFHPATNRPEPQVTIGKRISDRIRITASTGLTSETRDIRTAVELRVNDQTRIQGVYDNINRESSSSFGNVGVDLRYHLEFE